MGTQGPGRKRHPNREKLSAEDHALNQIAREAEARLAAKRAARAEAREIRMKELERQQKEIYQVQKKYYGLDTKWGDIEQWMEDSERYSHRPRRNLQASDEDDVMSVTSRSSLRTNGYEDELLGATQYRKSSRSSTGSGDTIQSSRGPPREESMPSLLNCNSLPSRSQRGSLYDEGVTSSSRRSSSSRPPSEYSCYLGSGSRASSRASSARASPVIEERPDKDFTEKGGRPVSSLSAATLASLGGTSSRRGSGDTSISVDTEASIREIKDSLAEVEEKYKRSMVTNAQLDNEKTSLQYQVDTLREVLLELEEELAESRRHYEDKQKECERQKHEQGVLRFQLAEMKEALEQREALLTEIRQLQQKQVISDREICDLKETIEWKDKKIGALERQKEFFDPVRGERDALREEVAHLRETLKKHGITLDSDSTLNGETPIEHHVNSDGPPDPPVRAVSMGNTEGTMERKETMSVVGECPPSETGQDRQETAQDPQKEKLHAEGDDVSSEHNEEKNSNTIVEIVPVEDVCSHHRSEPSMDEQKDEISCVVREDEKMSEAVENTSEVDGETTLKQSDVSPSGSEVFQDAIDFVDESPSTTSEYDEDVTGCVSDCEKEEPKNKQVENITKADDQCTMGGVPEEGAENTDGNTVNICKNDESNILESEEESNNSSSSHEEIRAETSENITNYKKVDLEHEVSVEDGIKPQQSIQQQSESQTNEENMDQNKKDAILSAPENSGDIDRSNIVPAPEQPSSDAPLTNDDFAAQVENVKSDECVNTEIKNVTEDEPIKDDVIPKDNGSQNEYEQAPEDKRQGDVLLENDDLIVEDQREEDTLSHDEVCGNIQNVNDAMANKAESPKEVVPPEVFGSEEESTQEDEEIDDADGTIRSEKYIGESEIPCSLLGSSVDRQSLEDIRMEDAPEKSPMRGKGKNKDDCVVS